MGTIKRQTKYMRIKATISTEIEITNEMIVDYAEINGELLEAVLPTTDEEIKNYFNKYKDQIVSYAKETAIDILAEQCDEVSLRGHYEFIDIEEVE